MLRNLSSFATDPPRTPDERGSVDHLLRRRVWRNWKLRCRVEVASGAPGDAERHAALHEVRKAAKRLRYSVETLVPAYGRDARRLARGAKRVQTDLGEVQDSAVTRRVLRDLAAVDGIPGAEELVLGRLDSRERLCSASAEARYATSWAEVSRRKTRRWLK